MKFELQYDDRNRLVKEHIKFASDDMRIRYRQSRKYHPGGDDGKEEGTAQQAWDITYKQRTLK